MMELTAANYFSPEMESIYMGSSSFKAWDMVGHDGCEAREMAKRSGEWEEADNPAFLLGSYVHSWSSGDLEKFISETPQLFKKDGTLLAKYALGDKMIDCFKNDPAMQEMREGDKEQIFTGQIGGEAFKIMVDISNFFKTRFCDIKTTRKIHEKYWNVETRMYESFIQKYDYPLQFAIYAEILRQNYKYIMEHFLSGCSASQTESFEKLVSDDGYLDGYILAVDKQEIPDHEIIYMDIDSFIKDKLEEIRLHLPHIMDVRLGKVAPKRCGHCDFCRSTKKITVPVHYLDLLEVI